MKTTIEISDPLLARARKYARRSGRTLRALVEEGLRRVLDDRSRKGAFRLPDRSVGDPNRPDPLEHLSWHELRDEIYGGRS